MQACLPVNKKIYPIISHPCPQTNLLLRFVFVTFTSTAIYLSGLAFQL